ncbi:MAG: hypothetical protein AB7G87_09170 [Clostridia bacterium]
MRKFFEEKFKDVEYSERQLEMFAHIVRYTLDTVTVDHENVIEAVFKEIIKNTYIEGKQTSSNGISKVELWEKIKVYTKVKDGNNYIDDVGNLSRHMCDYCIAVLTGAGLIYHEKKIQATGRGIALAKYFKRYMSSESLKSIE